MRPRYIWIIFGTCLVAMIATMLWVNSVVWNLEEAQMQASHEALVEENVRLALWRLDSYLAPVIAQENASPYFFYNAFYPLERAYSNTFHEIHAGELLVPSPLMTTPSENILLHFQISSDGLITSPQLPEKAMQSVAINKYTTNKNVDVAYSLLHKLKNKIDIVKIQEKLNIEAQNIPSQLSLLTNESSQQQKPKQTAQIPQFSQRLKDKIGVDIAEGDKAALDKKLESSDDKYGSFAQQGEYQNSNIIEEDLKPSLEVPVAEQNIEANAKDSEQFVVEQNTNSVIEQNTNPNIEQHEVPIIEQEQSQQTVYEEPREENKYADQQIIDKDVPRQKNSYAKPTYPYQKKKRKPVKKIKKWISKNRSELLVRQKYQQLSYSNMRNNFLPNRNSKGEGVMEAIWMEDMLLLARSVVVDNEYYIQGCWINWEVLSGNLLKNVEDLLPKATLEPFSSKDEQARILAMLPIQLIPGDVATDANSQVSPGQISLLVAWGCMILATIAITVLLFGVVSISERRASFVSSVTHELRTPLTTFRMYAEMLNEGMVSEKKQKRYFMTMLTEAKRLTHLVENVLEYARLERKRTQKNLQRISLKEVMAHMDSHIKQRAVQGNMNLVIDLTEANYDTELYTDVTIVEQIIFNLVDNACKYASKGKDKRIVISGQDTANYFLLKVRDYGPGIHKRQKKKLFNAFSKSAEEAAHSAPGVGLGLALSQRLAKHLHGKLIHKRDIKNGTMFVLHITK